jgi:CHAT domain-containing protein
MEESDFEVFRKAETDIEYFMEAGQWEEALKNLLDLKQFLELNGHSVQDRHWRDLDLKIAHCQRELGDAKSARDKHLNILETMDLAESDPQALFELGRDFFALGELFQAYFFQHRALELIEHAGELYVDVKDRHELHFEFAETKSALNDTLGSVFQYFKYFRKHIQENLLTFGIADYYRILPRLANMFHHAIKKSAYNLNYDSMSFAFEAWATLHGSADLLTELFRIDARKGLLSQNQEDRFKDYLAELEHLSQRMASSRQSDEIEDLQRIFEVRRNSLKASLGRQFYGGLTREHSRIRDVSFRTVVGVLPAKSAILFFYFLPSQENVEQVQIYASCISKSQDDSFVVQKHIAISESDTRFVTDHVPDLKIKLLNHSKEWNASGDANTLFDILVKPFLEILCGQQSGWVEHLYICPDGVLHDVPFEILPFGSEFFFETVGISQILSPRDFVRHSFELDVSKEDECVVYAQHQRQSNPEASFFRNPEQNWTYRKLAVSQALPDLDASEIELQGIQNAFSKTQVICNNAPADYEQFKLLTPKVLHFITHGITIKPNQDGYAPHPYSNIGLVIGTDPNSAFYVIDGWDIAALNLSQTALVCFSACDTAQANTVMFGHAHTGLTHAAVFAGARNTITTRWPVNDVIMSILIARLYETWRSSGKTLAQCLTRVKRRWVRDPDKLDIAERLKFYPSFSDQTKSDQQRIVDQVYETARHPANWSGVVLYGRGQEYFVDVEPQKYGW